MLVHHLLSSKPAPDWGLAPLEFSSLVLPSTVNLPKALLLHQTLAEEKTCSLVVIDGKVTVMHAMAEPPELSAQGGQFVVLIRASPAMLFILVGGQMADLHPSSAIVLRVVNLGTRRSSQRGCSMTTTQTWSSHNPTCLLSHCLKLLDGKKN